MIETFTFSGPRLLNERRHLFAELSARLHIYYRPHNIAYEGTDMLGPNLHKRFQAVFGTGRTFVRIETFEDSSIQLESVGVCFGLIGNSRHDSLLTLQNSVFVLDKGTHARQAFSESCAVAYIEIDNENEFPSRVVRNHDSLSGTNRRASRPEDPTAEIRYNCGGDRFL